MQQKQKIRVKDIYLHELSFYGLPKH